MLAGAASPAPNLSADGDGALSAGGRGGEWAVKRGGGMLLGALLAAIAAACAPLPPASDRGDRGDDARLPVVTTVLPVSLFTRAVAGDCARVEALIPASGGAHDLQERPADLVALRRARVLVKNGLGLEPYLDRLVAAADNPNLVVIDASRQVSPLQRPGAANAHVWLDPRRAAQQVETIGAGLARVDPACAEGYRRHAGAFAAQLRQLDRGIARRLAPYRGRTLVAFHDLAPAFAERYGLQTTALVDQPHLHPSPADLQRVARLLRRSRAQVLLSEPGPSSRSIAALAADLHLPISVFDPLERTSEAASRRPATYLQVMGGNAERLAAALAAAARRSPAGEGGAATDPP